MKYDSINKTEIKFPLTLARFSPNFEEIQRAGIEVQSGSEASGSGKVCRPLD